ncbi:MAG: 4Fe-4S dicluster domain-containing protein [Armatimonadota bacterium]|nr:4Fe-4S dicluster domain-containing protein [Armatimonadota bacterium]MDR7452577.1 4Fe-4S dicluster domain-containing protein [Armatimonadota bacterium]MDR7468208.1 4Fe-4S dicluster domain-containing protein [Armatimonadota bacterium]MDR7495068.1 4Fe-4S dicluster domain-containing protein [Armatimonadota bacterium]MDR7500112.1 4Fe-4S dicluster domain-containing protein [Armatimonadota bacterium]
MPEVYNWQLGRKMVYRFDERHPRFQFAAVFNINRCIGCQTCTMACKSTWTFSRGQEFMWWNNVETKPYGGYPQFWDIKTLQLLEQASPDGQVWEAKSPDGQKAPYGIFRGKTIFEAAAAGQEVLGYLPDDEEWRAPNLYEDTSTPYPSAPGTFHPTGETLPEHRTWFFHLQRLCNHCTYPACLAACPRNAIYKRPEDGIVLIDQRRCRGYRKCVEACPYKKPMFNAFTRVSEKCIACYPRVEGRDPLFGGSPMEARCMAACVGKIRLQGLIRLAPDGSWAEDRQHPLYYLVRVARVALPLYPQFGTQPNIYYIPPRWVPRAYLRQMFGPGVDHALEQYTAPPRELLAVLQLFRSTQRILFGYRIEEGPKVFETTINGRKWEMFNDTVIGLDRSGKEVVRLSVQEPIYTRPRQHLNSI